VEIGDPVDVADDTPEQETVEITEDEMPSQGHDPYNPANPEPEPIKEEQSIAPDEVGEMPKDILGG